MRREAIVKARVPGIRPNHVQCALCGIHMKESNKPVLHRVDHIIPASEPAASIRSMDDFFERLNVSAKGLQILCEPCHDVKTREENSRRKRKYKRTRRK